MLLFFTCQSPFISDLVSKAVVQKAISEHRESTHGSSRAELGIQTPLPEMLVCVTLKDLQSLCVEWNFKITPKQRISKLVIGFCVCLVFFCQLPT